MFDKEKSYARCYGRKDGAVYFQNGCYYKASGEQVSNEDEQRVQDEVATKNMVMGYTREALEEISDSQGMAGLRTIAEPLGVKGTSKAELITEILEAQGKQQVQQ